MDAVKGLGMLQTNLLPNSHIYLKHMADRKNGTNAIYGFASGCAHTQDVMEVNAVVRSSYPTHLADHYPRRSWLYVTAGFTSCEDNPTSTLLEAYCARNSPFAHSGLQTPKSQTG